MLPSQAEHVTPIQDKTQVAPLPWISRSSPMKHLETILGTITFRDTIALSSLILVTFFAKESARAATAEMTEPAPAASAANNSAVISSPDDPSQIGSSAALRTRREPTTSGESSAPALSPLANDYIVVLKDGATPGAVANDHAIARRHTFSHALNGFSGPIPEGRIQALRNDPRVDFVEPDLEVFAFAQTIP